MDWKRAAASDIDAKLVSRESMWLSRIDALSLQRDSPNEDDAEIAHLRLVRTCNVAALDLLYYGDEPWSAFFLRRSPSRQAVVSAQKMLKIAELVLDERRGSIERASASPTSSAVVVFAQRWPSVLTFANLATVHFNAGNVRRALLYSTAAMRLLSAVNVETRDLVHCAHAATGAQGVLEQLVIAVTNHACLLLEVRRLGDAQRMAALACHLATCAHELIVLRGAEMLAARYDSEAAYDDYHTPLSVLAGRSAVPLLVAFSLFNKAMVEWKCTTEEGPSDARRRHRLDELEQSVVASLDGAALCAESELGKDHPFVKHAFSCRDSAASWLADLFNARPAAARTKAPSATRPSVPGGNATLLQLNALHGELRERQRIHARSAALRKKHQPSSGAAGMAVLKTAPLV